MIVLVINCGSSSLKYQLYDMPARTVLARGVVEKIGAPDSSLAHRRGEEKFTVETGIPDHQEAVRHVMDMLVHPERGVLRSVREIGAVGHRVVHGGEHYSESVVIDSEVIRTIDEMSELAPLHNPANLMGIRAVAKALPHVPMTAIFDTAFHQTIPPCAYLYPLTYSLYEKYHIRKYGFHGSSHQYIARRSAQLLGKPADAVNVIICHLGNGASITAVAGGRSVDTTMGFTPLAGLMMGTRSGNIDPAIVTYLQGKPEYAGAAAIDRLLNKESGLLGISGVSNDMRALGEAAAANPRARLALDMFAYRVKIFIGAYAAVLGRVDAVVFTAGIGENDAQMRADSLSNLKDSLGIEIDEKKNRAAIRGWEGDVAAPGSRVRVLVVPTDEEGFMADETHRLCQ